MTAVVRTRYGVDHIEVADVEVPTIGNEDVLVRIHTSSINALDWHSTTGTPFVMRLMDGPLRPKRAALGADFAGVVEAIGSDVEGLAVGDRVFGEGRGAYAEYAALPARACARIPDGVSFEAAGAIGVAGLTALQGVRDHGGLAPGQRVLVNGGSGGVGTYAVQIAKALGADVTAVVSTRNVDMVRRLGADVAIDYTTEDFTDGYGPFDLVVDVAGNRSLRDLRSVMQPDGVLVVVGSQKKAGPIGPLGRMVRLMVAGRFVSQKVTFFVAKPNLEDLETLAGLLERGDIHVEVERRIGLAEVHDAIVDQGRGHARAKTVVVIRED